MSRSTLNTVRKDMLKVVFFINYMYILGHFLEKQKLNLVHYKLTKTILTAEVCC
jgi:hypothetical protein